MTADTAWSCALGLILGLGLWSLASRVPRLSRPGLAGRIAPYLADVSPEARRLTSRGSTDPLPVLGVLADPAVRLFESLFGAVLGLPAATRLRLRRAGLDHSVSAHRIRLMLWTVSGAAAGIGLSALALTVHAAPGSAVAAPIVGAGIGFATRDHLLTRKGAARVRRIESELPTVLEFLALTLAAGEGVHDALRRVARVGSGALSAELSRVTAEVAVGVSLAVALTRLGDELRIPALTRCLGHIVGALERGSPLAELLRAQAGDAREEARRALLEAAGKKEIGMLVPLVFLILPVTIAFAVFPGIIVLQTQL